ncbi:hypothetical protein [Pseudomonas panipatensis]|uniref:Phage tail protein C-terminal domain-containing protein n=1 Tax=Pseudomonas panipatensis TaxID=428992 RepID=A0A1G8HL57_9PSED|nr:hypothetical protein [Pseudomonas panipatensis]SDI07373.1 hypothetical protein SAMN05216272_105303 [Pseudomonas panipatensis]SMP58932.1 hypothetical protein SAMN06295951_104304 [Pseudomonas panipatensis]
MPWYSTGTVSVATNSPTVTGSGTNFSANARVGDAFRGPDGFWYEVTNVASATVLSIKPNYQSGPNGAGAYAIAPMQGYVKDSADALRAFVNQYGSQLASLGAWSTAPTAADARNALGLGSAATAAVGTAAGNLLAVGSFGFAAPAGAAPVLTDLFNMNGRTLEMGMYAPINGSRTPGAQTDYGIALGLKASTNEWRHILQFSAQGDVYDLSITNPSTGGGWKVAKFYTTLNTTMASNGVLSAASPIVRIADVELSERTDLKEGTFESAGPWGVANGEARGIEVSRLDVGIYQITGANGLAAEGWRTLDPCSPDGGRPLGITESEVQGGTVTIKLYKQRWMLNEDGEMVLVKGAPMDVPLNSWIDVRLDMPPPPEPIVAIE